MEEFTNNHRPELLATELERCCNQTQVHVAELVTGGALEQPLPEALRETQTLHALATSIQAWGLAGLSADFNKLLEVAGAESSTDREKANEIFQFILDRQQDWFVMNQFTSMEMFSEAWDIYQGLRIIMEERWPGCLPPVESGAAASDAAVQIVVPEFPVETEPVTRFTPDPAPELQTPQEFPVTPPSTAFASFDGVKLPVEVAPENQFKPVAPWLLWVVPPTLQQCEFSAAISGAVVRETNRDVRQDIPISQKSNPMKDIPPSVVSPDSRRVNCLATAGKLPAQPWLLPVVPPMLRHDEARSV